MMNDETILDAPDLKEVYSQVDKVAATDIPVLIVGETGTGKEHIAKRIHAQSNRKHQDFVALNMAAIPDTLVESTLFGTKEGAFTGALNSPGVLCNPMLGTLFLDEVSEMSLISQAKLLRVLETQEFLPVGFVRPKKINFRIIAGTNVSENELIESKKLREDLYYRLSGVTVNLPMLADRLNDLRVFLQHFVTYFAKKYNKPCICFSEEAEEVLIRYDWPGNVRELKNFCHSTVILYGENETLGINTVEPIRKKLVSDVIPSIREINQEMLAQQQDRFLVDSAPKLLKNHVIRKHKLHKHDLSQLIPRDYLAALLKQNLSRAFIAKRLGISRSALYTLITKHNLNYLLSFTSKDVELQKAKEEEHLARAALLDLEPNPEPSGETRSTTLSLSTSVLPQAVIT